MPRHIPATAAFAAVLTFSGTAAQEQRREQTPPASRVTVEVQDGRLSIHAMKVPLDEVLAEVSARLRIAIHPAPGLESERLSTRIQAAAPEGAIRELLKDYDAFFLYTAPRQNGASLTAVWVYRRGSGAHLRPIPPELWASTKDLELALADTDPSIREQGYEALMSRGDRRAHNLVVLAIRGASETDPELRQRILSSALSRSLPIPRDVLADLVRADAVEEIRMMALDALAGDPAARDVAVAALADPSEVVRDRARDVLVELDTLLRRREQDR